MNTEGLCMICTGFGIADEDENGNVCGYTKTEYCLDNLKDLQRFLRRDDPQSRDVFKQICKWNTVSRDIVPIIEHYQSDRILVTNSVKILVFLTMPVDPDSAEVAQQIEYLWGLKAVLTRNATIAVIVTLLEEPLGHLESGGFTEDDWKLVQLVLTLFRNILAIQSITIQQKASGSATELFYLTERFLELMFQENVMNLILVLAQHINDPDGYLRQDNLLLLEIFHHILLGKDPELIAKTFAVNHKTNTGSASSDPLRSLIEAEDEKRRAFKQRKFECRSKLSGTFTRFSMDGSKILLKNPASTFAYGLARAGKVQRGSLKKIAYDNGSLAIQKENILELLHNFLNQFLTGGYNDFMQTIHDDIIKEQLDIQKSDIISFFQVTHFITAFHQKKILTKRQNMAIMEQESSVDSLPADYLSLHQDLCGPIAATMNEAMYSLVMSKWREVSDGVKITNDYKFLTAAGSLLKSMVRMLDLVLKLQPEDSKECQTARVLLYKLFYDQTDEGLTQFLLNRFKCFDSHKQPKSDLADLLEIIHIMLRLMEKLQAHGTLRVSKKTRKRTVRNKASKDKIEAESELTKEPEIANEHAESVLTTYTDSAKSVNEKLSKLSSVERDQAFNECSFNPTSPVAFSNSLLNKELCHDHLSVAQDDEENMKPADQEYEKGSSSNAEELATNEVDFNISALVSSFASNTVIHNLCWLLKHYTVNSASTNHYILCMLRRFCEDLELSPMLYQLSLLTIFYEILAEQKTCKSKEYTDIINFLTKFLRKMFKTMKKQPLLFVEILFWKTRRECQFINAEILVESIGNLRKGARNLEDDQTGGFNHHRDMGYRSIADALGEDEIDLDLSQMHHYRRVEQLSNRATKSQVENGNIAYSSENETGNERRENPSSLQANETSRWSNHLKFTQEQETAINELYEKYKTERQCSLLIAKALDPDGKISPAFISRKLKHLGLPLAQKKKLVKANVPLSADRDRTIIGTAATTQLDMNNAENNFPPKISRRKRIRAFSLEEESQITILYEKFKGHKKRNVMIANTLNPDKKFTAAEVSRKLIQLDLLPPRKRSSVLEKHKERDEFNDKTENSDEETLLAFSERSNRKKSIPGTHAAAAASGSTQTKAMAQENDSDDDMVLKSFFKGGSAKRKMKPAAAAQDDRAEAEAAATVSQTRHTELLEDMLDSGDEMGRLVEPQKLGSRKRMVLHIDEEDD